MARDAKIETPAYVVAVNRWPAPTLDIALYEKNASAKPLNKPKMASF
jgi:hypothetical protein